MSRNEDTASMNEAPEMSITIPVDELSKNQLFRNIKEAEVRRLRPQFQSSRPKIQKVPHMLRDHRNFVKYYEPRVIAIGPLHHAKPTCHPAEKFKLELAAKYIKDSGCPDEDLHKIIEDNINTLRECYEEEATMSYTNEALADLLFLDGCSTLQFIYSLMNNQLADFNFKRDQVAFAQQDFFLLENQLPYRVLKLLMSRSCKREELNNAIHDYVRRIMVARARRKHKHKRIRQPEDTRINITELAEPTHLLDLLRREMLGPPKYDHSIYRNPGWRQFRNIQQLTATGVRLKPSKKSTLRDISFTSLGTVGSLNLPPIVVDDSMGPFFTNLIAYEKCPDFQNDFAVTSYICFMSSLISSAEDVKLLRSEGVLYNAGRDDELAQLFRDISTDLVPNMVIYSNVEAQIEKHYKAKWKPKLTTWMIQFSRDYFSSPWTILASLGVVTALGLSVTQTWYTINPPSNACDAVCDYMKKQLKIE